MSERGGRPGGGECPALRVRWLTEPVAVEVDGDERRRDGKIVDQREQLDEERQLLRRCYKLHGNNIERSLVNLL